MKPYIISAFPGTGKSTFADNKSDMLDLESSAFSWTFDLDAPDCRKRNEDFPRNYVDEIERILKEESKYRYVFISSHDTVRKELHRRGILFNVIYPNPFIRDEYISRYIRRGSEQAFVSMLHDRWYDMIDSIMEEDSKTPTIELKSGQYIEDILK